VIAWLEATFVSDRPLTVVAATTVLLSADIVLPVPSSVVCTFAGRALGMLTGLAVNWLGLNVSVMVGYWLGRAFGGSVAKRLVDGTTLEHLKTGDGLHGQQTTAWFLVICRAVPVLAEASVLLAGMQRLPATRFYPPVVLANLGIAAAYSVLGGFATEHGWFPAAVAIACAIPLLLLMMWKRSDGPRLSAVDR
jgi:uncharacterized membrane protein YdjX (TVP38/TMEM64 family)